MRALAALSKVALDVRASLYISNHMSEFPGGAAPPAILDGALRAKDHPAYPQVEALCAKYPVQAGALFQTFVDLQFAARWRELHVLDFPRAPPAAGGGLGSSGWAVVHGIPRDASSPTCVVPMDIDETLTAGLCVHAADDPASTTSLRGWTCPTCWWR